MDEHEELKRIYDEARKKNEENYKNNSKTRLTKNMARKFQTTMIGALAKFEEEFGDLWGQNCDSMTDEEQYWHDKWQFVRTAVLNNGNNQLRAALDEISQYTLTWNRYRTEFIISKQGVLEDVKKETFFPAKKKEG